MNHSIVNIDLESSVERWSVIVQDKAIAPEIFMPNRCRYKSQ